MENDEAPAELAIDQTKDQVNPVVAKGRALGAVWEPPGDEKPYVQFGWTKTNGPKTANDPFVGVGGCRYIQVQPSEIGQINDTTNHIRLYQQALKTQCVRYETEFLAEIVKDGLLRVGEDNTFDLVENSIHL